ncbi:MAG: hypothetical protein J0H17_17440, partial [Rhizobiales bacterium]|nr:hypothetical protein [Hyphomicrobiales bacterium]
IQTGCRPDLYREVLVRRMLRRTSELELHSIESEVRDETYRDILSSPTLTEWFTKRNVHMDQLAAIPANSVRVFEGYEAATTREDSEIATVLRIAHANLEMRIASLSDARDVNTASPILDYLKIKNERLAHSRSHILFQNFCEVTDIPNIGNAILAKVATISDLVKLRHTNDAVAFRSWFHEHDSADSLHIAREYIKILSQVPVTQSLPAKILRWVVSTVVGLVPGGNILGPILGGADTFLLDRAAQKPSPKFFVDRLHRLLPTDEQA